MIWVFIIMIGLDNATLILTLWALWVRFEWVNFDSPRLVWLWSQQHFSYGRRFWNFDNIFLIDSWQHFIRHHQLNLFKAGVLRNFSIDIKGNLWVLFIGLIGADSQTWFLQTIILALIQFLLIWLVTILLGCLRRRLWHK